MEQTPIVGEGVPTSPQSEAVHSLATSGSEGVQSSGEIDWDSVHRRLERMNLKDLRNYAKTLNVPNANLKADLIKRIMNNLQANLGIKVPSTVCPNTFRLPDKFSNASTLFAQSTILFDRVRRSECICNGIYNDEPVTVKCTRCGVTQHSICVAKNAGLDPYECPECLMARLDPLLPVAAKAFALGPLVIPITYSNRNYPPQVYESVFNVSAEQLREENGKELYVRCVRLDGKCNEHVWPIAGCIYINEKLIELFQIGKENISAKRKDHPILLKKENLVEGPNKVLFVRIANPPKTSEFGLRKLKEDLQYTYAFAVVETETLTAEDLVRRVNTRSRPSVEASRERFMRQLRKQQAVMVSDECICQDADVELPCSDPYLPGTPMKIPVYSKCCKHLQSFDLERFITMNSKMKLWKCPHCYEKALELVVDTYFEQLLAVIQPLNLSLPKIKVDQDGNFTINDDIKVKYAGGKLSIAKEEPQEDFRVRIILPKKILKPEFNSSCKMENGKVPVKDSVVGKQEQPLQFIPIPQLAPTRGVPSLNFDQIAKRPMMSGYSTSNTLVTIPRVVGGPAQAEGIEFLDSNKVSSAPEQLLKDQETAGKFFLPQVTFDNQTVKKAEECDVSQHKTDVAEMCNSSKNKLSSLLSGPSITYPEQSCECKRLNRRIRKWEAFSDYYCMTEELKAVKGNKEKTSGSKRLLKEALLQQRIANAKTHLAKENDKPASPTALPTMSSQSNPSVMPFTATPPANPYQFFEYCISPDSKVPGLRLGGVPGFLNPQQMLYKPPYQLPGRLIGNSQGEKIIYAPYVYLPNNYPGSGN